MTHLNTQVLEPPPLITDGDGVVRVGDSRVTLDAVVGAFNMGCTAEEILLKYPSLVLPDIYAVLNYYLHHQADVDAYMNERRWQADELRRQVENICPPDGLRKRLLARRAPQQ